MVTIARPLESGTALRDATRHNAHPQAASCSPRIPFPTPSPCAKPAILNALNANILDTGTVRAHASLLLAAAYGSDSPDVLFPTPKAHKVPKAPQVPRVIATQPSNTDFQADSIGKDRVARTSGVLDSPGVKLDEFDDMKRNLDISSLPLNPLTGTAPTIETNHSPTPVDSYKHKASPKPSSLPTPPSSSSLPPPPKMLDTAAPANATSATAMNGKKARLSPLASPRQSLPAPPAVPFTPGVGVQPSIPGAIHTGTNGNGPIPLNSPMHFGGPLTPNTANRPNGGLTVPSTPVVGMMPGMMGYGMGSFASVNYPTSPILSPSMNPNIMTGNYGPAAAAAAAAAAGNLTGRTVYVGNLPADASVDELLNLVRFGPIESVRLLPERGCVFISFLDGSTAAGFHADAQVKKLALHGQELKIGWGKASHLAGQIQNEVQNNQATRNVFVGNLDEATTEQDLRDALSSFGPIDQVKIVRDKNIGFVHFLSIATAMQVVADLPTLPGWENKRVSYGKDRCAYVPKAQQAAVQLAQQQALAAVQAQHGQPPSSPFATFSPMTPNFSTYSTPNTPAFASPIFPSSGFAGVNMNGSGAFGGHSGAVTPNGSILGGALGYGSEAASQMGNRTIYLGNLMPGTTTEELCNNIRGGQLQQVKHLTDKNIAFVTFVDPNCALAFYTSATSNQLTLNTRRLKVGWGKHSGMLNPALMQAIKSGASRNVYIGQIQDFEKFTADKLRQDFGQYGEIEMINFLQEKNAAFVNFTSIQSAQAAIEGIKAQPDYADMRVSFGKDRCANAPRPLNGSRPTPARNGSQLSTRGDANSSTPKKDVAADEVVAQSPIEVEAAQ